MSWLSERARAGWGAGRIGVGSAVSEGFSRFERVLSENHSPDLCAGVFVGYSSFGSLSDIGTIFDLLDAGGWRGVLFLF